MKDIIIIHTIVDLLLLILILMNRRKIKKEVKK